MDNSNNLMFYRSKKEYQADTLQHFQFVFGPSIA